MNIKQRLQRNLNKTETGCWEWTGKKTTKDGYGVFYTSKTFGKQRELAAHRVSYEEYIGPIPDGLVIDHTCRNKSCVNPEHLEAVTRRENTLRDIKYRRENNLPLGGRPKK